MTSFFGMAECVLCVVGGTREVEAYPVLPGKEQIFGRSGKAFASTSFSREMLGFTFDADTGRLEMRVIGINHITLREDFNDKVGRLLAREETVVLVDGNVLRVDGQQACGALRVNIQWKNATDNNNKGEPSKKKVKTTKAQEVRQDHDEDDDDDDGREWCQFGDECYRSNRDHLERYRHHTVNYINRNRVTQMFDLTSQLDHMVLASASPSPNVDDIDVSAGKKKKKKDDKEKHHDEGDGGGGEEGHVFAFCALPHGDFGVTSDDVASSILVDELFYAHSLCRNAQLVLCDLSKSFASYVQSAWSLRVKSNDDAKFFFSIRHCNVAEARSQGGVRCTVLGGPDSHDALDEVRSLISLSPPTKKKSRSGAPYSVAVDCNNILASREGVTHVVVVSCPSSRSSGTKLGQAYLAMAYRNLFSCFFNVSHLLSEWLPYSVVEEESPIKPKKPSKVTPSEKSGSTPITKFFQPVKASVAVSSPVAPAPAPAVAVAAAKSQKSTKWNSVLFDYCISPEKFKDAVLFSDHRVVVIRDAYPKARYHFLVMPRSIIEDIGKLRGEDVPLVQYMKQVGLEMQQKHAPHNTVFRMGFHSIPSMKQVHMHVISQDFDSEALKNKKHWNSFTTSFFVDVDQMIGMLKDHDGFRCNVNECNKALELPLKCHKCGCPCRNMPALKDHLKNCRSGQ